MYHIFEQDHRDRFHLRVPSCRLWGKKWNSILGSTQAQISLALNGASEIVLCSSCFFEKWSKASAGSDDPLQVPYSAGLKMVVQNVNFPSVINGAKPFNLELHVVEAFLLIPVFDNCGNPKFCSHLLICTPLELQPVNDDPTLADYKAVYKNLAPPNKPNVKIEFNRHGEEAFSTTSGYRNWYRTYWKNSGTSRDLITWASDWKSVMKAFGHASPNHPFLPIGGGLATTGPCICGKQLKIRV